MELTLITKTALKFTVNKFIKYLSTIINTEEVKRVSRITTKLSDSLLYEFVKYSTQVTEISRTLSYHIGELHRLKIIDSEKVTLFSQGLEFSPPIEDCVYIPSDSDDLYWSNIMRMLGIDDIHQARKEVYNSIATVSDISSELDRCIESCYSDCYSALVSTLQEYFEPRVKNSDTLPRILVKQYSVETNSISDFRRQEKNIDVPFTADEHKPFGDYISNGNKDSVFINNLPQFVVNGKYKNNRINKATTFRLFRNKKGKYSKHIKYKTNGNRYDKVWRRCFIDGHIKNKPPSSFYKSISVTPITLDGLPSAEVVLDFLPPYESDFEQRKELLFGFLCCDHVTEDFFIPKLDDSVLKVASNSFQLIWYTMFRHRELNYDYLIASTVQDMYNSTVYNDIKVISNVSDTL